MLSYVQKCKSACGLCKGAKCESIGYGVSSIGRAGNTGGGPGWLVAGMKNSKGKQKGKVERQQEIVYRVSDLMGLIYTPWSRPHVADRSLSCIFGLVNLFYFLISTTQIVENVSAYIFNSTSF